jgi:hypothetical protein
MKSKLNLMIEIPGTRCSWTKLYRRSQDRFRRYRLAIITTTTIWRRCYVLTPIWKLFFNRNCGVGKRTSPFNIVQSNFTPVVSTSVVAFTLETSTCVLSPSFFRTCCTVWPLPHNSINWTQPILKILQNTFQNLLLCVRLANQYILGRMLVCSTFYGPMAQLRQHDVVCVV